MAKQIRVGLVGYKFMGKAHSNAYMKAAKFFDLPAVPVMAAVCGRTADAVRAFARHWGWQSVETDYRRLVRRDDIDLIDVATPNDAHPKIVLAAAKAGKAITCEKPLARTLGEATRMAQAVRDAGVPNFVWFNYRRCPALSLARQMIREGRLGRVFHVRAVYLQDWIVDPDFPLAWRLQGKVAGSGSLGDIGAHLIDTARFLGLQFEAVQGMMTTFIKQRPLEIGGGSLFAGRKSARKGKVTVDDAALFLARFKGGAVGTFEATRFAPGRKNHNAIEINGSKGTIRWCFEQMNQLEYFNREDPAHCQGFRTILATEPIHPYCQAWWPPGHIIGYEHTFIHHVADMMTALARRRRRFSPDFAEALAVQRVLEAVTVSAKRGTWVKLRDVK
jgi:predicted dehydrogenase